MGPSLQPRRQIRWSALTVLTFCLPWLVMIGGGWCPLLAAQPATAKAPVHCSACCPSMANAAQPAPAPAPVQTLPCCETFKAFVSAGLELSKFKGQTLLGSSALETPTFDSLVSLASGGETNEALRDSLSTCSASPPSSFLRLVSRRCFPSLAPPTSGALLS